MGFEVLGLPGGPAGRPAVGPRPGGMDHFPGRQYPYPGKHDGARKQCFTMVLEETIHFRKVWIIFRTGMDHLPGGMNHFPRKYESFPRKYELFPGSMNHFREGMNLFHGNMNHFHGNIDHFPIINRWSMHGNELIGLCYNTRTVRFIIKFCFFLDGIWAKNISESKLFSESKMLF